MSLCFLNGDLMPLEEARISVLDRGFLLGDGVYEVMPAYGGRFFRLAEHFDRLETSLAAVGIPNPMGREAWTGALDALLEANGGGDQTIYLQITRGAAAKRDHAFPAEVTPTVFMMGNPLPPTPQQVHEEGIEVISLPDIRWLRCNIKSINLLPNVLMRQEASEQGAVEALLVRDGKVTEGAATNFFLVKDGVAVTPPKSNHLLPGITRDLVLELLRAERVPCEERDVREEELATADELWITSSIKEIAPATRLNDAAVGDGKPGPLYQRMIAVYQTYKERLRRGE